MIKQGQQRSLHRWQKFSKVSPPPYLPFKMTIQLTFERFYPATSAVAARLASAPATQSWQISQKSAI